MKKVFISYAWESEEYKGKVLSFVDFLRKNGFNASCDHMVTQNQTATHFKEMMAKELATSEKVIIILSEKYKEKADKFGGGVGSEYRYIIEDIEKSKNKYILVSFNKLERIEDIERVTPEFIKGREVVDLVQDEELKFTKLFTKLLGKEEYIFAEVGQIKEIEPKEIADFTFLDRQPSLELDIDRFSDSTLFFDERFRKAFPGIRGMRWFNDPAIAVKRLNMLLKSPLNSNKLKDPIWFFRGSSCLDIGGFQIISEGKCLIGVHECKIKRVGVYNGSSHYRSFVYVELDSEPTIGVYGEKDESTINYLVECMGYASEEYALFNDIPITRAEYDDGAADIKGDIVDVSGEAEIRVRYITPYNFVICAKSHPFNSSKGDELTKSCLDSMIRGEMDLEQFEKLSEEIPRREADY